MADFNDLAKMGSAAKVAGAVSSDLSSGGNKDSNKKGSQTADMVRDQAIKRGRNALGQRLANSAAGQALKAGLASAGSAVAGAASAAVGTVSGAPVLVAAAIAGLVIGAIFFVGTAMATAFSVIAFATATAAAAAVISLVALTAFIMFIINSGAYIVPPGGITDGIVIEDQISCFQFDTSWNDFPDRKDAMNKAATQILSRPGAQNVICAGGNIQVVFENVNKCTNPTVPSTCYGGRAGRDRTITTYQKGSETQVAALYTLAHETGHIVEYQDTANIVAKYIEQSPTANNTDCQSSGQTTPDCYLPSYPIGTTHFENRAEAIGLWLMLPSQHSKITDFQAKYPGHYSFATSVFSP